MFNTAKMRLFAALSLGMVDFDQPAPPMEMKIERRPMAAHKPSATAGAGQHPAHLSWFQRRKIRHGKSYRKGKRR